MKGLVVDDIPENVCYLEALLRGNGFDVVAARNGREAFDRLGEGGIDFVVSDILMPVMDGYQLCRAVRADPALRRLPFVFYTATYTEPNDREFALSLGADRFFLKPTEPEELVGAIRELLASGPAPAEPPGFPTDEEMDYLRRHNELLFRKLEAKMAALARTEEELRRSEARFREAVEFLPVPIGIAGLDGAIRFVNRAFTRAFGYDAADIPTIDAWTERAYPDPAYRRASRERWDRDVAEAMRLGSSTPVREYQVASRNGEARIAEIVMFPVGDALLTSFVDVTEQRRVEAELRHSQKMEALGTLAGGVAHDFNNILMVILSCASMIRRSFGPDTKDTALVNEILASVERASELTRSLLAFSRKQATKLEPGDLNSVVSELEKSLRRLIRENIVFRFERHPSPVPVLLDRSQVEQVMINLAVNARDAMPDGGTLTVSTSTTEIRGGEPELPEEAQPGKYAVLSFSDTGLGIDPETRKRIFEPFFTTKEVGKGTGLGLSIVYGIVARHGGHVRVDSEKGRGATFTIRFPLLEGECAAAGAPAPEEVQPGSGTVLLVEDDAAVRAVTGRILEESGYRVVAAGDGEAGLAAFREQPDAIDLVVSDVVMPKLDGRRMCEAIRAIRPGVPVIFMSGYPDGLLPDAFGPADRVALLQKPLKLSTLLSTAHRLIAGKR